MSPQLISTELCWKSKSVLVVNEIKIQRTKFSCSNYEHKSFIQILMYFVMLQLKLWFYVEHFLSEVIVFRSNLLLIALNFFENLKFDFLRWNIVIYQILCRVSEAITWCINGALKHRASVKFFKTLLLSNKFKI